MGFLEAAAENLQFLFISLVVVLAIVGVSELVERKILKDSMTRVKKTHFLTLCAMLGALATLLHLYDFPVPLLAPDFYKLDFSEIPVLICSFSLGPVAGVVCEFIKELLKLFLKGTSTAFVGDLANFVVGCSFILPASVVYFAQKTKIGAIVGMGVGTAVMTIFGSLFNAVYLIPAFSVLFDKPLEVIIGMGTDINPAIVSVNTLVLFAVVPFNLLKGVVVSVITFFLYKHIERLLRMK